MRIVKNYLYNASYQILTMILPIITMPYVARTLGATGLGISSYSYSVVSYFTLVALLGVNLYGNREIAKTSSIKERTTTFLEIYSFQFLTSLLAFILYIAFCFLFVTQDRVIYFLQAIYILACMFDISWFFMGLEQFKKTVTRNTLTKIIGTLMIFIFVKTPNDLWIYVLILALSLLGGQLVMWTQIGKEVNKKQFLPNLVKTFTSKRFLTHSSGLIVLFVPQLAIRIFTSMDKIILGTVSTKAEVGYYDNANKIARMLMSIVTSLGTVMLPRMSKEISLGNTEKVDNYLKQSMSFMIFLSVPLMFGIASITKTFVPIFFGTGFEKIEILLPILSIVIFTIATNNVMGTQYVIPTGNNRAYTISVVTAAIIDIIFNVIFVVFLKWESIGTAIASVLAEITLLLCLAYFVREKLYLFKSMETVKAFIAGLLMASAVFFISINMKPSIKVLIIEVIVGVVVYLGMMLIMRSQILGQVLNSVKGKLTRS